VATSLLNFYAYQVSPTHFSAADGIILNSVPFGTEKCDPLA